MPHSSSADSEPILENTVVSVCTENIVIDMSCALADGYYKLELNAPDKYFREPKAWLFMVSESKLVNPYGTSVVFKLIPPDEQKFQPYRGSIKDTAQPSGCMDLPPPSEPPSVMMEWMLSLSAPAKQPLTKELVDSTGYHYFGYQSSLDCPGIWGRFTVVDPGVRHGTTGEFVADHIYVCDLSIGTSMEIGWAEVNFEPDDVRYMFEYDPGTAPYWRLWDIPESPLEVALKSYGSDTWYAMYVYSGNWYTMAYYDLGFTEADYLYNKGEVYTDYGDHPSLPSATTDVSKLYISDNWVNWDWQRWATTQTMTCDTYDIHTYTSYYYFYIHKH